MHSSCNIESELEERIKILLSGTESISQFIYKATEEKVKRMEARNERARLQILQKDKEALKPIIESILSERGIW